MIECMPSPTVFPNSNSDLQIVYAIFFIAYLSGLFIYRFSLLEPNFFSGCVLKSGQRFHICSLLAVGMPRSLLLVEIDACLVSLV
jgi:hypothetical protein